MKKLLVYSLIVAAIVFTSCPYTEPEPPISKECNIESFYAGGKNWEINGLNITAIFSKATPVSSLSPIIQISDKATIRPLSGVAQDFSNDRPVTYTVTAEDGKTQKTYTAKATVQ